MGSSLTPRFLQVALAELYRLEAQLRAYPEFREYEALRHLLEASRENAEVSAPPDPAIVAAVYRATNDKETSLGARRSSDPKVPPETVSHSANVPRGAQPRSPQLRYGWGEQSRAIRITAEEYLRATGKRATGGEICNVILEKGIEIRGGKPSATVASCLTQSDIFDHKHGEGYGLREWANSGGPS